VDVPVPDVRARDASIELLLREGLGRAPQAEEARTPQLPESLEAIETMSWQELQQLAGILLLDTFDDVHRRGGEVVLRERVAAIGKEQRRFLREVLADAPASPHDLAGSRSPS
jgi:hypothetical protein